MRERKLTRQDSPQSFSKKLFRKFSGIIIIAPSFCWGLFSKCERLSVPESVLIEEK